MKRLKYVLLLSFLACAIGCQNKTGVMSPIDDYIEKTEEDTEVDIDDDIETDDIKKEEKDEFVSDFEEGSPEYLFEQFLRDDIDAKPFQLKKNVLK